MQVFDHKLIWLKSTVDAWIGFVCKIIALRTVWTPCLLLLIALHSLNGVLFKCALSFCVWATTVCSVDTGYIRMWYC